jgi:hypothetical protein
MQEADAVRKTEYWQALVKRIEALRGKAVTKLISDPVDTHRYLQGQIWAIDRILEYPVKIVEDLRAKTG